MDENQVLAAFNTLWFDAATPDNFPATCPLLAYYTSIETLECIMRNNEIWLSNPLFMNDKEELSYGINIGVEAFVTHGGIAKACGTSERAKTLNAAIQHYHTEFSTKHAFDVYALCFCAHNKHDNDGSLSMWRGYGGYGSGAAIVLDTAKLEAVDGSPLVLAKVEYGTHDKRVAWMNSKLDEIAVLLRDFDIPDEFLYVAAFASYMRIKFFALFSKHSGFSEENEWRVVYMRERDSNKALDNFLDYSVGQHGIEPKLKLKFEPIKGVTSSNFSLNTLVDRIILGPTASSPLARASICRMLERVNRPELADKVCSSSIPFRSTKN